ncbi:hypothetical protein JDV02_005766 [Purpureocillium takamizusanense]|uniref:Uncharacterized protein n=1 Tax=Purpureocillium takamizusanense TaxID=2060973 RepID=A0A9Q8QI46_9HYPO|nr:uncharacterized protein JDV02_005766 [Purpureocillium takamizusanense]UNI19586.1 hypothetical protein JDV02_005766 [Purpureocillium takamizusanense]
MAPRVLTEDDRRRIGAFNTAMEQAMSGITEYDPEEFDRVRQAVWDAHPIEDEVREAYAEEDFNNSADPLKEVEATLKHRSFKADAPWGLAVYRVAYGDDAAWDRMLQHLHESVESIQQEPVNQHLYPRHRFEIMDDKSQFDGATISQLRDDFSKWVLQEYRRNCKESERPSVEDSEADEEGRTHGYSGGARYNFFLVVDDICLESMDQACGAVVKAVQRTWSAERDEGGRYSVEEIQELGPIQDDSVWEGGLTESSLENVGWMYMETTDYVSSLESLSQPGNWEDEYLRPPQLRWQEDFDDAPGSWRRASSPRAQGV